MASVDDQKLRILDELSRDASRSRKQIAHELDISESYLSKLIRELVEEDRLIERFTILPNYRKLGHGGNYMSLIKARNIHTDALQALAAKLCAMPEAVEVYTVYGERDFFVRWICRNGDELMSKLNTVLAGDEISEVTTYALGQEFKRTIGPELSCRPETEKDGPK